MTMRTILEFPVPQAQKWFKVPVDPLSDASGAFNVQMPGKISVHDGRPGINHQIWPLLRCLDADNILRIAEVHSFTVCVGVMLKCRIADRSCSVRQNSLHLSSSVFAQLGCRGIQISAGAPWRKADHMMTCSKTDLTFH